MKWFLFFIFFSFACCNFQQKEIPKQKAIDSIKSVSPEILLNQHPEIYIDSFIVDNLGNDDTGYFKNLGVISINQLNYTSENQLNSFLDKLIDKKNLILLNNQGLSHSCRVSTRMKYRYDTLRNEKTSFIQKVNLGNESEDGFIYDLSIDGHHVKAKGYNNPYMDALFDFDAASFLHFTFHGNHFYYIRANEIGCRGTSMGNVSYHLIYNLSYKKLSCFETCRMEDVILFGDVNGDNVLDFIDFDNSDFCTTVPSSDTAIIQLYSCKNGKFILQKDKQGKAYRIEGNTGVRFTQDSFIIRKYNWPVKLKK